MRIKAYWMVGLVWISIVAACAHKGEIEDDGSEPEVEVLDAEPLDSEAQSWIQRGVRDYARGDFTRAIQKLEAASAFGNLTNDPWAGNILFYCYLSTGAYPQAVVMAQEVARRRPYDSLSYEQLGIAQLWSRKPKVALDHFAKAREFEAHSTHLFFYEGLAHAALGSVKDRDSSFTRAEAEYRDILRRNPHDLTANIELATLLLLWNRKLDEVGVLTTAAREALKTGEDEDQSWNQRLISRFYLPKLEGSFLAQKNQGKAARRLLLEALSNAPSGAKAELAEIYMYLSINASADGETDRARSYRERAYALDPTGPQLAVWKQTRNSN